MLKRLIADLEKKVEKLLKKVEKKVESHMVISRKLTKKQKEVMDLIHSNNIQSVNELATVLKCSDKNIYKLIKNLEKKGVLVDWLKKGLIKPYPLANITKKGQHLSRYIRCHGVEVNVKPYYPNPISSTDKYSKVRALGNRLTINGWTIRLYPETFEVYSGDLLDWRGESVERATRLMEQDLNKLFSKLEARLGIGIVKADKHNISQVNCHYAEVNNEIAKELDKDKVKLTIYGKDGYAWFKIDTSWNFNEAEAIHPQLSKQDAQLIFEKYLNDLRNNNPPTNSELATYIKQSLAMQAVYNENIKKHLSVLDSMDKSLKAMNKMMGSFVRKTQTPESKSGKQKGLSDFF